MSNYQEFLELIEKGNRHELTIYRNRIIDEQQERARRKITKEIVDLSNTISKEQKAIRRHCRIATIVFSAFIVIGIGLIIIGITTGEIVMVVFNAMIIVINSINVSMYRNRQKLASIPMPEITVVTNTANIHQDICSDTEEMLEKKKARLDEILGF